MTKMPPDWKPRRISKQVSNHQVSMEAEQARRKTESETFYQRCRAIFEQVRPELIEEYYNCYIVIEPDSGDYFIDKDDMNAFQKMREKHPKEKVMTMRLNQTGACGRI